MKKQFVTYEIALKLKELGYNEQDFGYYRLSFEEDNEPFIKTELEFFKERYDNHNFRLELHKSAIAAICTAPLWQQAIDWFRTEHNLHIILLPFTANFYSFSIYKSDKILSILFLNGRNVFDVNDNNKTYNSLELSRDSAILRAIELIEKK